MSSSPPRPQTDLFPRWSRAAWGPGDGYITFATDIGLHTVELAARRGKTLDTGAIAKVQVVDGQVWAAWGKAIRILSPALDVLRTFEQASVARMRAHGDALFAASWSGADAGVHRWDLGNDTRRRLPTGTAAHSNCSKS